MSQYLKPDSELGYIEDSAEIECLKFNNLRHSVLGCMLGDFNEVGNYVVKPEIVKELISMEKYIVQTYDNIELCKSVLKLDKQISFLVTFEGNKATLSLIEKMNYEANFAINSGTYSNINEYVLDSVETSGEINRNVVYDRWNISPFSGQVVDIFNCDETVLEKYFGIVNRFKYLLEANKILLEKEEELEEIEAEYTNNVFEILKHYPKLEKVVVETIKQTLEEKKDSVSVKKPFFAKTFNEVVENAIEKNISALEEKEKQEFEAEKRNSVLNLNIKRENVVEVEHQKDDIENEISPANIFIKVPTTTQSKSITELGEQFVSIHKTVVDALAKEQENKTNKKSEKDKLIATLVGAGVGALVGGATGAAVGAVAGATVAEVAGEKQNNKANTSQSNKTENKQTGNKKDDNKKGDKKTKTDDKKSKTDDKKTKTDNKDTTDKNTTQSQDDSQVRFFAKYLSGLNSQPTNNEKEKGNVKGKAVNSTILDIVKQAKESTVSTEMVDKTENTSKVEASPISRQNAKTLNVGALKTGIGTETVTAHVVKQNITKTVVIQEVDEETHTL